MLGDLDGLEVVAVVCCCLVAALDRLSGFPVFAIHSACLGLPSVRLSPYRQALGLLQQSVDRILTTSCMSPMILHSNKANL